MSGYDDRFTKVVQRISQGIFLREDSRYLLRKVAELEVELAEARGAKPLPSGSIVVDEQVF